VEDIGRNGSSGNGHSVATGVAKLHPPIKLPPTLPPTLPPVKVGKTPVINVILGVTSSKF
jgi:hypothetical protein